MVKCEPMELATDLDCVANHRLMPEASAFGFRCSEFSPSQLSALFQLKVLVDCSGSC